LKELRLASGLVDYRELTGKLNAETQVLDQLKSELDQRAARAGACEAEAERLEMLLADLDDQLSRRGRFARQMAASDQGPMRRRSRTRAA